MSRFSTLPSGVFRKNIRKNAELNIIAFGAVVLSCFLRPLGTQSPVLVSFLGPVAGYVLYKFYQYASKCCPVVMQEEKVTREELRLVSINQNPKWFAASCAVWQGFAYIIPYYAGAHFFEHDDGTKWDSDVWLTGLACYSAATAGYLVTSAFLYAARKTSCYNSTSYEDKPYGPHFDEERQRRLLAGDQPPGAVLELRERSVSPGLLRL